MVRAGDSLRAAVLVYVVVTFVAVLLFAERTQRRGLKAVAKTLASVAFCALALDRGAWGTPFGRLVFVGLVLSLVGDVLLLSKAKRWFLAGLVVFLLAHVGYGVGFTVRGVDHRHVGVLVAALLGIASFVWRWLGPHVGAKMRLPVLAYVAVISWMLATAIATSIASATYVVAAGALSFYLSDLFVARERFVKSGFENKVLGLPLYYGGQLLIAWFGTV